MEYLTIVTHVTAYLLSTLYGVKRKPPKLPAPILLEGIDNCTAGGARLRQLRKLRKILDETGHSLQEDGRRPING
jgi:hypothetical protein